jgi:hypothetical protein
VVHAPNTQSDSRTRVLPAYRVAGKTPTLKVWCDYCRVWHGHGEPAGHRVAHCLNPDSPYRRGGYDLEVVGDFTEEVRASKRGIRPWRWRGVRP